MTEEYLLTEELSGRIKLSPGTIRNLVWQRKLVEGIHYVKPTRKLLFKWSAMEEWLNSRDTDDNDGTENPSGCRINI